MKRRILFFALLGACVDPVHDEEVAALGPEAPGVEEGELHRPGQPCLVCHGGKGPGEPDFGVAGTVYLTRDRDDRAREAIVTVTDARQRVYEMKANEVGNFYVEKGDFDPVYPLRVEVAPKEGKAIAMATLIRKNGDCGWCHRGGGDSSHTARVYATESP